MCMLRNFHPSFLSRADSLNFVTVTNGNRNNEVERLNGNALGKLLGGWIFPGALSVKWPK